jgi:hypothetical protein
MFVKPTVLEHPHAYMDKRKVVIGGEDPVDTEIIKKPLTKRSLPICHHCGISGHIRPKCPQCQGKKRHATLGTKPLARYLALQHQLQQHRFVPANLSGKTKKNKPRHYKEKLQRPEIDQSYEGPPIFSSLMQNLLRWMEN